MHFPVWKGRSIRWVLLDRDGVINQDSPDYVRSVDQWQPIAGSLEAMARLYRSGCQLLVVTNQSGIGRGYFPRRELFAMHRKLASLLTAGDSAGGVQIEGVLFCPHLPDAVCDCRKPAAGLLHRAMTCFHFSTDQAVMVGDSARDLVAANGAGIEAVRVGEAGEYATLSDWVDGLLQPHRRQ
jgi:D-glycero-D-manno-heptose 1,7-bisphosphate phosphatase